MRGRVWGLAVPLPNGGGVIFSMFELKKMSFGAFWVLLLQLNGNWLGH